MNRKLIAQSTLYAAFATAALSACNGDEGTDDADTTADGGDSGGDVESDSGDDAVDTGDDSTDSADGGSDTGDAGDAGDEPAPSPSLEFVEIPLAVPRAIATDLRFLPDSDEFFIVEKNGIIGHYRLSGDTTELLGEFTIPGIDAALDCGLISVAFDPDFATNNLFYLGMCTSPQESGVYRFEFDPTNYDGIGATSALIITVAEPRAEYGWHNVGSIGFDSSGALWALFGEKTHGDNAQMTDNLLGKMVRIIPEREGRGYTVPEDNPFVDTAGYAPEIYSLGLRSPWRGILDHRGRWWIGDVGADAWEEINLVTAPGQNFGWPTVEGRCELDNCEDFVDPVAQFGHGDDDEYIFDDEDVEPAVARSVWIGLEYRDRGNDRYDGRMTDRVLFGDICLGFVRAIEADESNAIVLDVHAGHQPLVTGWDQGPDGYIYATTFGSCETRDLDPPPTARLVRAVLAD